MWRAQARIRPQASSDVACCDSPGWVWHTVMPRCRRGVEIDGVRARAGNDDQLQVGQLLDERAWHRHALAHEADDVIGLQRRGSLVDGGEVAVEHVDGRVGSELAPIGEAQSHALIIVEDGDADHRFTLDHDAFSSNR